MGLDPDRSVQATDPDSGEADRLGRCVHTFAASPPLRRTPRSIVVLGILSVIVVPISLQYVRGTVGTFIAVLGALVALACYLLSGPRRRGPGIDIKILERGIRVTQGSAMRELLWNEIVEVSARTLALPGGRQSVAIVFEVVGEQPLLIMVGAPFSDAECTRALVEALSGVWLSVWRRRASAMLQSGMTLRVGSATLSAGGVAIGDGQFGWHDIQAVEGSPGPLRLRTSSGLVDPDDGARTVPFPSSAQRLCAVAPSASAIPALPLET